MLRRGVGLRVNANCQPVPWAYFKSSSCLTKSFQASLTTSYLPLFLPASRFLYSLATPLAYAGIAVKVICQDTPPDSDRLG
jgi:hypothetical protein